MATTAIQNAINAANAAGGGIVYVPAGVYKCGNLVLKSNVSVYLEGGSVIRGQEIQAITLPIFIRILWVRTEHGLFIPKQMQTILRYTAEGLLTAMAII